MNLDAPYSDLTPNCLLDAVDSLGMRTDGRLLQLNSFENRVYQVWLEDGSQLIAKFYRPGRWSDEEILEEHEFSFELAEREIPVVPPLLLNGKSLHHWEDHRFSLFLKQGGRSPELEREETLEWLGRFLGRIHAVGASKKFQARPTIDLDSFGIKARDFLIAGEWLPIELRRAWTSVVDQALDFVASTYERVGEIELLRIHGDCHPGNILWTVDGPHFVDFDDSRNGPSIQDLWMLLPGAQDGDPSQLTALLRGYETFREFNDKELHLVEALRTLRLIHHSYWIARRWTDPAFPLAFPWFGSIRYWQDCILELREQVALMQEPHLL